MNAEKKIRQEARDNLSKGNWGIVAAAVFTVLTVLTLGYCILSFISFFPQVEEVTNLSQLDTATKLLVILIQAVAVVVCVGLSPIYMGFVKMCTEIAQGGNPPLFTVFTYFTSFRLYKRALHYAIALLARYIGWGIVSTLPAYILVALLQLLLKPQVNMWGGVGINSLCVLLGIAAMVLWVLLTRKYYMASYLFVNDVYEGSPIVCIKRSAEIMKNRRVQAAKLTLSFLPWILFCFFVLPVIYVLPYYKTACSVSAKWIDELHREKVVEPVITQPENTQIEGLQGEI